MAKAKKPTVAPATFLADAVAARLDDSSGRQAFPVLSECLTPVYVDKKLVRQAGKLTISAEGAHWRVRLDCPTEVLTTTMAATSLVDILEALEGQLASGRAVWSPGWSRNKNRLPTVDDVVQ